MNIKNEEELFWNNNIYNRECNLGYDLFMNNRNTGLDLDIKPDDFGIFETTESYTSKVNSHSSNQSYETQKSDSINNSSYCEENNNCKKVFDIQKCPKSISDLLFKKSENNISKQNDNVTSNHSNNNLFIKPYNTLTLAERMKFKKEKAKMMLERKREKKEEETLTLNESQLIDNVSSYSMEGKVNHEKELSKKEMKAIRNRISAQLSRDRKKKEFEDLQIFSQKLLDENKMLKRELTNRNRDLINLNNQLSKLCNNCSRYFEDRIQVNQKSNVNSGIKIRTNNPYIKYGVLGSFLVIICLIASCFWTRDYNKNDKITLFEESVPRYLIHDTEETLKDYSKLEEEGDSNDETHLLEKQEDHNEFKKDNDNKNDEKNSSNNTNALMTREEILRKEYIDYAIFANKKFQIGDINLSKYLNKKRVEYLNKLNKRLFVESKIQEEKTFLRKKRSEPRSPICLKTNKVFLSVQEDKEGEDLPTAPSNPIQSSHYVNISKQANNQVIPLGNFLFENKIHDSVRSILCPNFVTDRKSLFSNLFNNTFKETTENKESLDCVYMHLLFPGEDDDFQNHHRNNNKKAVFYEVGCKIYEINKIYR